MIKFITTLMLLFTFLLSATTIQATGDGDNEGQSTPETAERKFVRGGALGVKCLAPGNRESVAYDYTDPETGERVLKTVENVMVGSRWPNSASGNSYRCMGRCGFNCWGHPGTSRMYTQDCLALDVCSQQQNANGGGSDKNCGDEFVAAVGDTALSLVNICGYTRRDHFRAARDAFVQ